MMSSKFRNRLIGIIALILFSLIIAPYVITDKTKKTTTTIPLLPPTNNLETDTNQLSPTELHDNRNNIDFQVNNSNQHEQYPANNQSSNIPRDKGYVIQLVALKNKQKIDELIALLRLNNYDVYTVPQVVKDGQLTRLLVGNYQTREQAEMVIIDLENLTKLKGYILQ